MPGKADAWLKILRRRRNCLPVVAQAQVQGQVRLHVKSVLHKGGQKPLGQFIAADPKVDRLLIILHVGQSQLIERQSAAGARAEKREGTKDGGAGFAARAARLVMQHAPAKAEVVRTVRPGQRVRKLKL